MFTLRLPRRTSAAFTMIELIVVIVILGLLALIAIPTFKNVLDTSELKTAEVTAGSLLRETVALAALNETSLITDEDILAAAADLSGEAIEAAAPGTYAAVEDYGVVLSNWEFSGNSRTISVVKGGDPVGSTSGAALVVPGIGCAFAKSEGSTVTSWSVKGLDAAHCNGLGAYQTPEALLGLSAPPTPAGLEVTFGCSVPGEGEGWEINFNSGLADLYINGEYFGQVNSGDCVPGSPSDQLLVVPSDGTPGWEGSIGDIFGDGAISIPDVPTDPVPSTPPVSTPIVSNGTTPTLVSWVSPAGSDGVNVSRRPIGGAWTPVNTADRDYTYDTAPEGTYEYQVQPTIGGTPTGAPIPVLATPVTTPAPVASDGGSDTKPAVVLVGNSAVIAWGAVANTPAAPLSGYHVYRSINGSSYALVSSTDAVATTYTNAPLNAGTYCYQIASYGLGGISGRSAESCVQLAPAWEDATPEEVKLTAHDGAAGDTFGYSVDIDGATMVVGSYLDIDEGVKSGSVYVYTRTASGWEYKDKLTPTIPSANSYFGWSVAISGETIVVGAYGDSNEAGAAYVYTRTGTTWTQQKKLIAGDRASGDRYGLSVDISGATIVIGSYLDYAGTTIPSAGSVYVYVGSVATWTQQKKLYADNPAVSDYYGYSVALDGDTLIVGAYGTDDAGSDSGSAFIYSRDVTTWTRQAKLTAHDAGAGDNFGTQVGISGTTVVIGAPRYDDTETDSGSAYVFKYNGTVWGRQGKIIASDGAEGDRFGNSIAIEGDTIIVGSRLDDDKGTSSGSAYIFGRNGSSWTQQTKLTASDSAEGDNFGQTVSINGNTIVAGSPRDDDKGTDSGSVYSFTLK